MEHHNLDNKIKEKLNQREIQPSAQAWDRLDAMLAVSEEKKQKKGYGWYYVAASTILFFGLGFFLFNSNETTEINNSIPIVTKINEEIDSTKTNKINQISIEKEQLVLVQNEVQYSKKISNNTKLVKIKELNSMNKSNSTSLPSATNYTSTNIYNQALSEKLILSNQKQQVITNDSEIISKSKLKIDASFLLSTVEKELDENHRETALDKVNRMLKETKSVVANRNYE